MLRVLLLCVAVTLSLDAGAATRARDLGVPFNGVPGACNAITDVAGVEVGHRTLVSGEGALKVGQGPVRTGVTAVFPKGRAYEGFVPAGVFVANGTGELTGRALIEEIGEFSGDVNKIPFLADIPVVGLLFQEKAKSNQRRQRLFMITPRIIELPRRFMIVPVEEAQS